MNDIKKYPTEDECFALIRRYKMLPNIVDHSVQVMRVSLAICNNLKNEGSVNTELVVAAALLHDIAKTQSIERNEHRHDLTGGEILRELGQPEIAEIVENHVIYPDFSESSPVNEKDIIYYADKRVMHDRIVTIDERIDDLVIRYGRTENLKEMILKNKQFVLALEGKIKRNMKSDLDTILRSL